MASRYLRAKRKERFFSLITAISLAGVALGTFSLTVALSVMSGFEQALRARLLAFTPRLTVTVKERQDGAFLDRLSRRLKGVAGITDAAPFAASKVLVVSSDLEGRPAYVSGATLRGLAPGQSPILGELSRALVAGSLRALAEPRQGAGRGRAAGEAGALPGAVLGESLALELGLRLGDPIIVVSPASLGTGLGGPRLERFAVVGLVYSGMYEFDASLVAVALERARFLLKGDPLLEQGVELRSRSLFAAPRLRRELQAELGGGYAVRDWTQANAPLFAALKLEKFTYFLVLLLMVLVAAFNIVATLAMVALERRREIAILSAMGARGSSVGLIFLCQGGLLGLVGTALGAGAGWAACLLIGRYHLIRLPADLFMVSSVPVRLSAANFLAVVGAALLLSLAAALLPALKARALSPVEVIRYE